MSLNKPIGEILMTEYRVVELLKEIKGLLTSKPKSDNWIDIKEASKYTSVSTTTLRRNVEEGKLKASKKLGKILFKQSDIEEWLNA